LLPSLAVAFFPKCPICWAAYLSVFGMAGIQTIPYSPWLLPVFILMMLVNLLSVFKRSKHRNGKEAFYLSALGTAVVLVSGLLLEMQSASFVGIAMIFAGSLISSLPERVYAR
jgi:protein SCO1/2